MAQPRKQEPRLSAEDTVVRNRALIADRLKPMSWVALAAKYNLHERYCRRIFYKWSKSNQGRNLTDVAGRDPIEIVYESVARYEGWIEQLTEVAFSPEASDASRVAAITAQMNAQSKLTELLQATGILPRELGKLRIVADVRYVAQAILTVFEEEKVPTQVRERVIEVIRASSSRN
jgi:hypothetical protein